MLNWRLRLSRLGGKYALNNPTSWESFIQKRNELAQNGYRLVDLITYTEATSRYYVGVFKQGGGGNSFMSVTGYSNFTIACEKANANGMRLVDVHMQQ